MGSTRGSSKAEEEGHLLREEGRLFHHPRLHRGVDRAGEEEQKQEDWEVGSSTPGTSSTLISSLPEVAANRAMNGGAMAIAGRGEGKTGSRINKVQELAHHHREGCLQWGREEPGAGAGAERGRVVEARSSHVHSRRKR